MKQGEWGKEQARVPLNILKAPWGVPVVGRDYGETRNAE